MYLVSSKTGILEEILDTEIVTESSSWSRSSDKKDQSPKRKGSSFTSSSGLGGASKKRSRDDFVPEITRTSDKQKKRKPRSFVAKKASESGGEEPLDNGITRTSDSAVKGIFGAPRAKPPYSSRSYAVFLLSKRDYTEKMLRERIVRRGYSVEEAEEALVFVIANKYQSDERFAQLKANSLQHKVGNARVMMTLREKGIDIDLAKEQLEGLGPEVGRAIQAVSKFRGKIQAEGLTEKWRVKIYRFLAQRGFSQSAVKEALKSLAPGYAGDFLDDFEPE